MHFVRRCKIHFALIPMASLALTGCLAPGMHMSSTRITGAVNDNGDVVQPEMTRIDPAFIQRLRKKIALNKQMAAKNYRMPDGFYTNPNEYEYIIGPQDILNVIVWDHPNLSNPSSTLNSDPIQSGIVVDQGGEIYYPYVGKLKVAGLTPDELRQVLTEKLSKYIKEPQINVRVAQFNSKHAYVTGAVNMPVSIPLNNVPISVVGAIQRARGPIRCGLQSTTGVDQRLCANEQHVIVTQHGQDFEVDLDTLKAPDNSSTNWILEDGAHVYVSNNNDFRVFVLGAVNVPGPYNIINNRMSLSEAIGDASGASISMSNPAYTYVIRNYHSNPEVFWLNLRSPEAFNLASEFPLKPSDVVFVSTSELVSLNQVMTAVNPLLTNALTIENLRKSIRVGP